MATHELADRLCSTGRNQRQAEEEEGNVDDDGDNGHVHGHVRGPRQADTGNGRWWRLQRNGDNANNVEEGDRTPPPHGQWQRMSWRIGCVPPAATSGRQRRERATSTMTVTTDTSTGVSGVRVGRILGMGDGGDRGTTVTMRTTSRRADIIPPP
jgi:hypothetical protein